MPQLTQADPDNNFFIKKVLSTTSLILVIYFNFKNSFGLSLVEGGDDQWLVTPFTGSSLILSLYWLLFHILQVLYLNSTFYQTSSATEDSSWLVFNGFNILQIVWVWLFRRSHFILSEIVAGFNFLHIILGYIVLKTYSTSSNNSHKVIKHASVISMPFAWLMYVVFLNAAVFFGHADKLWLRIVCNVLIWDFLIVGLMLLVVFNDWITNLGLSMIMFAVTLGQLGVRVFALQWIFALANASALCVAAVIVLFNGGFGRNEGALLGSGENEALIRT